MSQRGSIRKRTFKTGDTWTCYWRDQEGRLRSKGGFATKREAQRHLIEVLGALQRGDYVEPSKLTVADFLTDWLETLQVRPKTAEGYLHNVAAWIVPALGAYRLAALTPKHVATFYASLRGAPRRDGRGTISARTGQYVAVVLRHALGDAVRAGLVPKNVAASVERPKAARPEMKAWSSDEARAFLASVEGDRLRAMWHLLLLRGLRRGEVLGLRWKDVDLEGVGRIAIRQTLITVGYEIVVSEPKTDKGRRVVPLDPGLVSVLRAHRARQAEERLAWGEAWTDTGLVFTREDGTPIHPMRLTATFGRLVKRLGLPPIRLHDLRHTCATISIGSGIPTVVVSSWLGHANTSITDNLYRHVSPAMLEEAGAKLSAIILGE